MDEIIHLEIRTKYNLWDLLGDIGGLNDGLMLISNLFMLTYSALSFRVEWLRGQVFDSSLSSDARVHR